MPSPRSSFPAGEPSPHRPVGTDEIYFVVRVRHPRPDVLLVTAVGEVDVLTVSTLEDVLDSPLPPTTVLDLSELTLLSAVGLRVLEKAVARAAAEGRHLRLVAASRWIVNLLRMTELDLRVPVYRSISEALGG